MANKHITLILMVYVFIGFSMSQTDNTLTPEETALGWSLLFDGTRNGPGGLNANWTMYEKNNLQEPPVNATWQVNESLGEMFITANVNYIRTKKSFKDYVLKFDYKINGNQGFVYNATLCGAAPWESGTEMAMDVNYNSPKHSPGDAYDMYASESQNFKAFASPNPWNKVALIGMKDSIEHWQNDEKIVSYRFWSQDYQQAYASSKYPNYNCFSRPYVNGQVQSTGYIEEGYFSIQGNHGGDLYIKNIKILENPVIGCTDSTKIAYNPEATFSYDIDQDGSMADALCTNLGTGGCKDTKALNYNATVTWHAPNSCQYPDPIILSNGNYKYFDVSVVTNGFEVQIKNVNQVKLLVTDIQGKRVASFINFEKEKFRVEGLDKGIYNIQIISDKFRDNQKVILF